MVYLHLKRTEDKNVSKGPALLWKTQIQTTRYDLDKKEIIHVDTFLIYTLLDDFLNDFDAQSDFGKRFVTKMLVS